MPLISGLELANITSNPGLLDSNLGHARIIDGYHVLTHFYDLATLANKTAELRVNYEQTLQKLSQDPQALVSADLLLITLNATFQLVETKLNDIRLPVPKTRARRGLINGLGSIIKFITGNLDHEDETKYNAIIAHLQRNQEDFATQVQNQYSVNEAVQINFNKTVELITKNNQELKEEIDYLITQVHFDNRRTESRALLEHYQIVLNLVLSTVQDIENSLVACRSNSLHPSVIDSHLLLQELARLSNFYGDRLLNFRGQNLFEIQSHIKVKCYIGVDEIVYFLNIPIVDPRHFEVHLVEPLPTFLNREYLTVIPAAKYFLKSRNEVYPLTQNCPSGHLYLCPNYYLSPTKFDCETTFLKTGSTKSCKFIKLIAESNSAKLLLEINQYLLFFPESDAISVVHPDSIETKTIRGIYLISPGKQTINYKNQTLFAPHNEIAGKPSIVTGISLELKSWQIPDRELHLKDLDLMSLELPKVKPIKTFQFTDFVQPSLWTLILYLTFFSLFGFTCYHYSHHTRQIS